MTSNYFAYAVNTRRKKSGQENKLEIEVWLAINSFSALFGIGLVETIAINNNNNNNNNLKYFIYSAIYVFWSIALYKQVWLKRNWKYKQTRIRLRIKM